jgi:hypothetical protein
MVFRQQQILVKRKEGGRTVSTQQVVNRRREAKGGHKIAGIILVAACIAFLVYTVAAGAWLKPDLGRLGMSDFLEAKGATGGLVLYLWLFSLPLGMILGVLGVAIGVRAPAGRIWAFGAVCIVVLMAPITVASIVGESVPAFFGTGGILIEVFLVLMLWYWGRARARLEGRQAWAADLRLAGYAFFAFATWNLCGIGAQPIFMLQPEKMIEFNSLPLALQMIYAMMTYLVVGWGLTFASHFMAARAAKDAYSR